MYAPIASISPLIFTEFARQLVCYPEPKRSYVLSGIQFGFRVGFVPHLVSLRPRTGNLRSAALHPNVIDSYLAAEVAAGRVAGPLATPPWPHLHTSPFGVIEKNHQPGKWRLILDLSSPRGHSVNDGIPKDPFSLQYVTVDMAIKALLNLGPGALMAKFDVKAAYRNIPIHPADRFLLGMHWQDGYYIDLVLPFGLRSAPFIFDSVAAAVEWILKHNYGIRPLFHYLDDFLTMGPAGSPTCQQYVDTASEIFHRLGLPLHEEKCIGPSPVLTFLGIELDSIQQIARQAGPFAYLTRVLVP